MLRTWRIQLSSIHWDPEFSYQIPEEAKLNNVWLIQKHTSPCCWLRQGQCGGGLRQGVQVQRNENNRLKQQAPQPIKNSPCFAGFLGQSVRAYICGLLCACAAGPGVGSWGPSREGARTCLHILNGNRKGNHQRCSNIRLAAPTITSKSPSFHKHFIYIFKWEYFCSFGKSVPLCGWVCLICALHVSSFFFFSGWEARAMTVAELWRGGRVAWDEERVWGQKGGGGYYAKENFVIVLLWVCLAPFHGKPV